MVNVGPDVLLKLAVTVLGPLILRFCGVAVPLRLPLNPENWYPLLAAALTVTTAPALYQPLAGLIVPPAAGVAVVVR